MRALFRAAAFVILAAALTGGCEDGSDSTEDDTPVTKVDNPGVLTALVWSVIATPVYPVAGSDGLIHLAYEIQFANVTGSAVTVRIDSVEVVDPTNDNSVISSVNVIALDGTNITYKVRNYDVPITFGANNYSNILGPGQFGVMYMDVTFESEADVPQFLGHRVTTSVPENEAIQPVTTIGGYTEVSVRKPISLGSPLKGDRWIDGDGCCTIIGPHRFVINPVDGKLRLAERFAIDFVQLDEEGKLFEGDPSDLNNWHFYGAEIYAAASGRVVGVLDGLPDQPPGQLPPSATIVTAGGNHVVVDMGDGRFALYAHLIPNSIAVSEGEFVEKGRVLGRLGNSGNTDAPHLHFHVMDSAAPLNSNGLPYVFKNWEYQGRLAGESLEAINANLLSGQPAEIDITGAGTIRNEELPLTSDVIGFK